MSAIFRRGRTAVCVTAFATCLALPAAAQDEDAKLVAARNTYKIKNVDVDLSVPESPAFTALGLNPDTIVRPATPREFATALLNGVDKHGKLQTGVAFDMVPYLIFAGSRVTLADYRGSRMTQVLSRTSVSVATTKGATDDDKTVKVAFGVHATLFDSEDPRLQSDKMLLCFAAIPLFPQPAKLAIAADKSVREKQEKELADSLSKFERETLRPGEAACREQFSRKARWNGTSWIVAAARTGVSATGMAGDLAGAATTAWSSLSYGFDRVPGLSDRAQLVAHVRHVDDELVLDEDLPGGQEVRDVTTAGAQIRAGSNAFALAIEAAYQRSVAAGRPDDVALRLSFSAERRLAKDVWLTVALGGDRGADAATNKGLSLLSSFKWGFAKDPSLMAQ
jgi:hypothetical protein